MNDASDRKYRVTVTLKSGAQLVAECDSFQTKRNAFGELTGLEWENLSAQWLYLDVGQVAAIESVPLRESVSA